MNSFFRKNALVGLAEIGSRVPLVLTVGYLARNIGTESFGNWALILIFQVLVTRFSGLGLSSALFRFTAGHQSSAAGGYLKYSMLLCLIPITLSVILSLFLSGPIGRLLGIKSEFYWLLPLVALTGAGSVADGLIDAFLKSCMAVVRQIIFITTRTLIEVVAVVLVFVTPLPPVTETSSRLAVYVCIVGIGKLVLYPGIIVGLMKSGPVPSRNNRREFVKYGLVMVPVGLAGWLINQSDRLVLSHFVPKADLGVYAFGASLAAYTMFLASAVLPLLLPGASRLYDEGNYAGVRSIFQESQKLFMLLWAGWMICLALWADTIIAWTGGVHFAKGREVFLVLSFAVGIDYVIGIYQYAFNLIKRPDQILWLNLSHAGMIIASVAIAALLGGVTWAAWAVLFATVLFNLTQCWIAVRLVTLPVRVTLFLQIVALGLVTAILGWYSQYWSEPLRLILTAAVLVPLAGLMLRRRVDPITVSL